MAGDNISAIAIDAQGNKWIGIYGVGVSKFDGTNWTTYTQANMVWLVMMSVAIAIDAQGNKWFGTSGGVSKFDEKNWTTYTKYYEKVRNDEGQEKVKTLEKIKPILSIDILYTPGILTIIKGQIPEQVKRATEYKNILIKEMEKNGYTITDDNYDFKFNIYFMERKSSSIWSTPVGFDIAHYSRFEISDGNDEIIKSEDWMGPSMNEFNITGWYGKIITMLNDPPKWLKHAKDSTSTHLNNINDIAIDHDGSLLFGTGYIGKHGGISKFDGKKWATLR